MKKLAKLIIEKNRLVIVVFALITLFLGFFLRNLRINPDILSYFPKNDPDVQLLNYLGEEYGGNSLAMIVLETGEIFTPETIAVIHELTTRLQLEPGVAYVTSLTNTLDIKTDEYGFEIGRLVDTANLPRDPEALTALKEYTLSKEMFRNNLVTEDATATLIICRLQTNSDQVATCRRLQEIVAETAPAMKIYYGGIPFMILDLNNMITDDLKVLIPMVSLVIIIFLYLGFRKWEGVFLPLLAVAISLIWTLGVMSLLKIPLSIISNVIPVVLFAVGNAYTIHVLSRFNETRVTSTNDGLATALYEVGTPVSLAGLTTIAGFISFIFGSYLVMIQEFGVFAALGVLFTLFISLTFIPALLALKRKKPDREYKEQEETKNRGVTGRITPGIEKLVTKKPKTIVWVGVLLTILALTGIPRISRRVNLVEYFQPQTAIRQAEAILDEKFGGSGIIQILAEGDIQDPAVLREMEKMEEFLLAQDGIHSTQSVVNLLKELNNAMGEGKVLPDTKGKVMNLWFLLEGEEVMTQLVNAGRTEAVIQARIAGSLEGSLAHQLVTAINEYTAGINPELVKFSQTGMPVIYRNLDLSILKSQFQSLIFAVLLVFIIMLFLLGSLAGGLLGLIPILFTLALVFGFMGYAKIPLDIATVLVASVTIGIGIDYSIHFLSRYRQELADTRTQNLPVETAVRITLNTTGRAILINVFTVAFGFLSLVFSQLVPIQRFGVLVFVTMLGSGFGAIILLPAVLLFSGARSPAGKMGIKKLR
ncbi:MAG: RND family transporter [Firmicutes bacterium]|nr:RND family transporter [Bacillota bacterium]